MQYTATPNGSPIFDVHKIIDESFEIIHGNGPSPSTIDNKGSCCDDKTLRTTWHSAKYTRA